MITLNANGWNIKIDPAQGALFHLCEYKLNSVFRPFQFNSNSIDHPQTSSGNFPLLPYSNRIEKGRFSFSGRDFVLPPNTPDQKHPLHGTAWLNPWQTLQATDDHCHLKQNYQGDGWPWAYQADYIVRTENNQLRLELILENKDKTPMPSGLGFHPYFPDLNKAILSFQSRGVWLADHDVLPREWVETHEAFNFSSGRKLRDLSLDHCFTEVGPATISWEDSNKKIVLRSSENLTYAAVFTDRDDNAFCFEPVSHVHNAINMAEPANNGVITLDPGVRESCWFEIDVYLG